MAYDVKTHYSDKAGGRALCKARGTHVSTPNLSEVDCKRCRRAYRIRELRLGHGLPLGLCRLWADNEDKIESISDERSDLRVSDGIWIYLKDGWCRGGEQLHCVHEWTVQEVIRSFRAEVRKCECEQCVYELARDPQESK